MGRVPLKTGAGRDFLKRRRDQPGMLGVRLTFHRDADRPWLTDGTADGLRLSFQALNSDFCDTPPQVPPQIEPKRRQSAFASCGQAVA
jgi:hypothetical protein